MRYALKLTLLAAAGLFGVLLSASTGHATVITSTLPEFNGDGNDINTTVGTFSFSLPVGETINSVTFAGTFGNSEVQSTALEDLFVDGVLVASCLSTSDPCWTGRSGQTPINFNFSPSDFSLFLDGAANLVVNQTGCCVVRLGPSTLTIVTEAVPEPKGLALVALGLLGLGAMAWRRRSIPLVRQGGQLGNARNRTHCDAVVCPGLFGCRRRHLRPFSTLCCSRQTACRLLLS